MGDETRQVVEKLDDVIRRAANKVNEMAISQARHEERTVAIHEDVKELKVETKLQNGRIGKLEQWRWYVMGAVAVVVILLRFMGCASPCAPGYDDPPIKTDSVTVTRIDTLCSTELEICNE